MTLPHSQRFTAAKIASRLALIAPLVYRRTAALAPLRYRQLDSVTDVPPVAPDADDSTWTSVVPNSYWGQRLTSFVLRGAFRFPADWDASLPTALWLPLGTMGDFEHPEALIYVDGEPYAAVDRHHDEMLVPGLWRDGQAHALALHGYAGGAPSFDPPYDTRPHLVMGTCALVQIDAATREFVTVARLAHGTAVELDDDNPAHHLLLNALDAAFLVLDTRAPLGEAFYASVPAALARLRAGIAEAGAPLPLRVTATGHAHIDVAWLWTFAQTRHKARRTFTNVLRLMEEFPDYHFTQSQPQLYAYVREDDPALFEAIKARVAEGRWEPIGGMWVEADCNLSGGEALVRQFLYGRAFFREHFGAHAESPVLWLPDVFGYAANLPQLIRGAGLDYFFTIKIGWSQYNRLPHDTFWWQGIDGTRVLTHFSTTPEPGSSANRATYNAEVTPQAALGTWRNLQQKHLVRDVLMSFGYGDGGGGPSRELLANLAELGAFPALPRLTGGSVIDFFRRVEHEIGAQLPVWNGELYLELHRGTYTSQARVKQANRRAEIALHNAEFLAACAWLVDADFDYLHERLRQAWRLVLLNQFHDVLPGSSIGAVYVDALANYDTALALVQQVQDDALAALTVPDATMQTIINPTSFAAVDDGERVSSAYSVVSRRDDAPAVMRETADVVTTERSIQNGVIALTLNDDGDIDAFDASGRRVGIPGRVMNQLQAFEDRPINWDAWDIDNFYEDRMTLSAPAESIRVVEASSQRGVIEMRRRILNSAYTLRITLKRGRSYVDFDLVIDWREQHTLLKVAFPVNIHTDYATYDVQWGSVRRPTHRNTSWDWARFETVVHRWVNLSDAVQGVTLSNAGMYGCDVHDNVLRLSLLRSPTFPDAHADQGEHRFGYRLAYGQRSAYPMHALASALNNPPLVLDKQRLRDFDALHVASADENAIVETIKVAEDGGGLIVRLYECAGAHATTVVRLGFDADEAWITNLLEENQARAAVQSRQIALTLTPFQIVTLRIMPKRG